MNMNLAASAKAQELFFLTNRTEFFVTRISDEEVTVVFIKRKKQRHYVVSASREEINFLISQLLVFRHLDMRKAFGEILSAFFEIAKVKAIRKIKTPV